MYLQLPADSVQGSSSATEFTSTTKAPKFPGAEALSAGLSGGQESNGNHTGSTTDSSGGDNDSKSMKPSSGGSHNENDDDDDGNGDGGKGCELCRLLKHVSLRRLSP